MRPEVAAAMARSFAVAGNASSVHAEGRAARALIETARAQVAALVGAAPQQVVFTSGGTEANNLALASGLTGESGRRLLVSPVEHPAVTDGHGVSPHRVERLRVDPAGLVDLAELELQMARGSASGMLVALQLANNETGVIQPVEAAGRLAHRHGALLHADGVQAAGRIPLDIAVLGIDSLALSAHKLGGPSGVGALVLAPGRDLGGRLVGGGGQERGRRGGTENLSGIVGFGVAAEIALRDLAAEAARLGALRDRLQCCSGKARYAFPTRSAFRSRG
jgi:cysteine desulfurase